MKIKHSTSTIVNPQENPYSEDLAPPPSPTRIIKAAVVASPTGKHPLYKGIRSRGMKWVSEIREPHKTTRIWLGTYATPEMAAAAYDAASLALKGPETVLNFPHHKYNNYNVNLLFPASTTAAGIRMAAANAAASRAVESESLQALPAAQNTNNNNINVYSNISSNALLWNNEEYVDEEELYYMPNLLMNMAEGMLISPPRDAVVLQPSSGDEEECMWSYS